MFIGYFDFFHLLFLCIYKAAVNIVLYYSVIKLFLFKGVLLFTWISVTCCRKQTHHNWNQLLSKNSISTNSPSAMIHLSIPACFLTDTPQFRNSELTDSLLCGFPVGFSHLDVMLVECYDPKGDQWNILQTPILEGRSGPGCAVLDDSIYLVGGYSWSMVTTTRNVYRTTPLLGSPFWSVGRFLFCDTGFHSNSCLVRIAWWGYDCL